jgi:hypothetical protein
MCILATAPRITSAAVVRARRYGDAIRHARQRGASRPRVYRAAHWVRDRLESQDLRQGRDHLRQRVRLLEQRLAQRAARGGPRGGPGRAGGPARPSWPW